MNDLHGSEVVLPKYIRQLAMIGLHVIQFGATDKQSPPLEEPAVEIRKGEGNAVGGDELIGVLKVGRFHGDQMKLYRPLT